MQRLTSCSVLFGVLAGIWACSGDPTNNSGKPTFIVADPTVVFVTQGDSQGVVVSVVDEDGLSIVSDFSASNIGTGITVNKDPNFLPTQTIPPTDIGHQARFFVKGVDVTSTSFVVNASGLTKTVTVNSVAP
jgi:hypothetical protein